MDNSKCKRAFLWLKGNASAKVLSVLCLSLAVLVGVSCISGHDCLGRAAFVKLMSAMSVFAFFCLFPRIARLNGTDLICTVLLLWTVYETVLGFMQLYGRASTMNVNFPVTGSFDNPNPYAVLLSTSICVLCSWRKEQERLPVRLAIDLAVILAVTLLPATRCRAAWLGLVAGLICTIPPIRKSVLSRLWITIPVGVLLSVGLYLWKKPSADGRLQLWRISVVAMSDGKACGLLGHGAGHYAEAVSEAQTGFFEARIDYDGLKPVIPEKVLEQCHKAQPVLYAYCDPLQIGVETGPFGMLLLLTVNLLAMWRLFVRGNPLAGGMIALSITGLFMYTLCLWQFYLLNAAFVAIAVAEGVNEQVSAIPSGIKAIPVFVSIMLSLPWSIQHETNRKAWEKESYLLRSGAFSEFVRCEEPRLRYLSENPLFMGELVYAMAQSGQVVQSDSISRLAYGISGNPCFLMQLGDNCYSRGEYAKARDWYLKTFLSLPDRIAPLARIAQCCQAQNDSAGLESMKQFVRSFHTHVDTQETQMLRSGIESLDIGKMP